MVHNLVVEDEDGLVAEVGGCIEKLEDFAVEVLGFEDVEEVALVGEHIVVEELSEEVVESEKDSLEVGEC